MCSMSKCKRKKHKSYGNTKPILLITDGYITELYYYTRNYLGISKKKKHKYYAKKNSTLFIIDEYIIDLYYYTRNYPISSIFVSCENVKEQSMYRMKRRSELSLL